MNWRKLTAVLWLLPAIVMAAIVTSADIVRAIQNSPNASSWLKQNAQAVANLAINVESGGNTTAYNGSCCYGVLQMNQSNIAKYAGVTAEQYRQLPLQDQINAWSKLTNDAMRAGVVNQLIRLGTFDGRAVDGNLVLACVQLGIGNCQRMVNSGSCSGFADRNGTTICSMADRMANGPGGNGNVRPPTSGNGSAGGGWAGNGGNTGGGHFQACPRDPSGGCMAITEALQQGFLQGSGVSMQRFKTQSGLLTTAVCFLVIAAAVTGVWRQYADGRLSSPQLVQYAIRGGITLSIVLLCMAIL